MSTPSGTPADGRRIIGRLARAMADGESPQEVAAAAVAVDRLFAAERDRVRAICHKFLGDSELAHDAAQDVLLIAYTKLPDFKGDSSFRTWLYGIARYRCYDIRRKRQPRLHNDGLVEIMDETPGVISVLRSEERAELLRSAAAAVLSPMEQRAIHLRYVELVSQDQIGEILGLDGASGGRGLLQRCRRKLNREIRRRLEEMGHGTSFVRRSM